MIRAVSEAIGTTRRAVQPHAIHETLQAAEHEPSGAVFSLVLPAA
jgi:hypothetical protein